MIAKDSVGRTGYGAILTRYDTNFDEQLCCWGVAPGYAEYGLRPNCGVCILFFSEARWRDVFVSKSLRWRDKKTR